MASFRRLFKRGYKRMKTEDSSCDVFDRDRQMTSEDIKYVIQTMERHADVSKLELIRFLGEIYFGNQPNTDLGGYDKLSMNAKQTLLDMLEAAERNEFNLTFHFFCGMISFVK
jgi:hypothetical protein